MSVGDKQELTEAIDFRSTISLLAGWFLVVLSFKLSASLFTSSVAFRGNSISSGSYACSTTLLTF